MNDEKYIILLYDEDDNETEFEVVATLEVDENEYVLLPGMTQGILRRRKLTKLMFAIEQDDNRGRHTHWDRR